MEPRTADVMDWYPCVEQSRYFSSRAFSCQEGRSWQIRILESEPVSCSIRNMPLNIFEFGMLHLEKRLQHIFYSSSFCIPSHFISYRPVFWGGSISKRTRVCGIKVWICIPRFTKLGCCIEKLSWPHLKGGAVAPDATMHLLLFINLFIKQVK